MTPRQGERWWAEAEGKRRPVLVVTRNEERAHKICRAVAALTDC